ncbi:5-oxoprolinase subunit PxpA [Arcobacter arenosus]|uniref:5-oxoprolinase subunit PxpA n=1 Tax=Arcobacter arenosus TaxID=2576037 RepID=A0A5R8Y3D9_9BACT|nr:5-oxoprolinase subunit PxpA [Arcobacter arenosus]TLP40576.1 5-oxoprolinase subunit PxpA [Arcobacter arenosus]
MVRLNCDMGESFGVWKMGKDEEIIPYIHLANLACGFHASDAVTMNRSVELAKKYNVTIGAHASYNDLLGFGRRSIPCSLEEIKSIVLYQLGALNAFCKSHGTYVSYVKPHGALYNDMMKDENIFKAVLSAISSYDKNIKLMILSKQDNEAYAYTAKMYGIELIYEIFADRNYNDDGTLVSRVNPNSIIEDELDVLQRMKNLIDNGYINSINGNKLFLKVDTICVHGDGNNALNFIRALQKVIN